MKTEDLKLLAEIGEAIWGDRETRDRSTAETIFAVSLLNLDPEKGLEKAGQALLERAERESMAVSFRTNVQQVHHPFYRLPVRARFLLAGLHLGRWTYQRLARIFSVDVHEIEAMAWKSRLALGALLPSVGGGAGLYPAGAKPAGPNCPDYEASRPWTQRFLDEEIRSGSERLFLQNHLMACESCRAALNRCRDQYFGVEKVIPRGGVDVEFVEELASMSRRSQVELGRATDVKLGESFRVFLRRPEIRLWIALFATVALVLIAVGKPG